MVARAVEALVEDYYESGNAPHEALGRAARKLLQGGALYLGGGVGLEKQSTKDGDRYNLTRATGKGESFTGPLSAVMRGFALAGAQTGADTPGGESKVTDPAAAARLRELVDEERRTRQDIQRYEARLAAKTPGSPLGVPPAGLQSDDAWEARRLAELRRELAQISAERAALLATGKVEEAADSMAKASTPEPFSTSKTSNWVARGGGLPAYIQHIAHDLMEKRGMSESRAIQMAIGIVKNWASGKGKVDANTRAAASKAVAEWEALKAKNAAKKGAKAAGKVKESVLAEARRLAAAAELALDRLEAVGERAMVQLAEASPATRTEGALVDLAREDLAALAAVGHPLGEAWALAEGFMEGEHPRDFLGKFKKKVAALKVGETAHAPGGVTVTRHDGGFSIKGGAGLGHHKVGSEMQTGRPAADENLTSPNSAAMLAVTRSLRSRDAKSLGGAKHYQGLDDYEGEHGKPKPDPRDASPPARAAQGFRNIDTGNRYNTGLPGTAAARAADRKKGSAPERSGSKMGDSNYHGLPKFRVEVATANGVKVIDLNAKDRGAAMRKAAKQLGGSAVSAKAQMPRSGGGSKRG